MRLQHDIKASPSLGALLLFQFMAKKQQTNKKKALLQHERPSVFPTHTVSARTHAAFTTTWG